MLKITRTFQWTSTAAKNYLFPTFRSATRLAAKVMTHAMGHAGGEGILMAATKFGAGVAIGFTVWHDPPNDERLRQCYPPVERVASLEALDITT